MIKKQLVHLYKDIILFDYWKVQNKKRHWKKDTRYYTMTWEVQIFSLIVCYLWDQTHFGKKIIQQEQVQFSIEAVFILVWGQTHFGNKIFLLGE